MRYGLRTPLTYEILSRIFDSNSAYEIEKMFTIDTIARDYTQCDLDSPHVREIQDTSQWLFTYRKTPNKRPWAFAATVGLKRTLFPSCSFLRNKNRTIFSRDIA